MKMKQILLIISVIFFSVSETTAQKADKGAFIAEGHAQIGAFWFYGPTISPAFKFRYFLSDKYVVNTTFNFSNRSRTTDILEFQDGSGQTGTHEYKYSNNSYALGCERHFGTQEKFSPFIGLNFNFEQWKNENLYNNAIGNNFRADYRSESTSLSNSFGVEGLVGADYWINRNFYIGTDMGVTYKRNLNGDTVTEVTTGGVTTKTIRPIGSGYELDDRLQTSFRLGFRFN